MNLKSLIYILFVLVLGALASCGSHTSVNPTYTVTYDGNGNTGGTAPTDTNNYGGGAAVTVAGAGDLVKTGNTFTGWNTAADGSGTARLAGSAFAMGAADVILYAQWTTNPTYTVTYDGNTNTGGTAPTDSNNYEEAATVTVAGAGDLVKTGNTFTGWNTAADGSGTARAAGSTFAMGAEDVILYAQWTANPTYTVTYDGHGNTGGTAPTDSNNYEEAATVTVAVAGDLVKTGDAFTGWNTAADGSGTARAAGSTFEMGTENVILYAQWTSLAIGVAYQGGIVAYILQEGDPGYVSEEEKHGLIAATADQSEGIYWHATDDEHVETGWAIGAGQANTTAIITAYGTEENAAKLCHDYSSGGYEDWYLPSEDELYKLYLNKASVGGFGDVGYWSSTEDMFDSRFAYALFFDSGIYQSQPKSYSESWSSHVRCVRAF